MVPEPIRSMVERALSKKNSNKGARKWVARGEEAR